MPATLTRASAAKSQAKTSTISPRPAQKKTSRKTSLQESTHAAPQARQQKTQSASASPRVTAKVETSTHAPKAKTPRKNQLQPVSQKPAEKSATLKPAIAKKPGKFIASQSPGRTNSASTPATEIKGRRVRAPKDLALQYGETTQKVRAPQVPATERKARRDAAARQKRKEFMTPDDELLARLARAGMIASSLAPEVDALNGHSRKASTTKRRPRSWQSQCGKCGAASTFKTAVGLCVKCGAIAVRD